MSAGVVGGGGGGGILNICISKKVIGRISEHFCAHVILTVIYDRVFTCNDLIYSYVLFRPIEISIVKMIQ